MEFPGVRALDGVDFDVVPGEVHALIGENGAGKSTLIKILSGEIAGYDGEVRIDGTPRRMDGPREAIAAGIAVIPQELQLVSSLSVAENIFLGRPRSLLSGAKAALETVGETHVAPEEIVAHLEAGQRQLVAIARALSLDARLIIMDEPTTSLSAPEAARLERLIERLCARGVAIVYISHKLDEVERLADRITVLRDGKRIVTRDAEGIDEAEMVRLMVGRQIDRGELVPVAADAPEVLRVEDLSVEDPDRPGGPARLERLIHAAPRRDPRARGPHRRRSDGSAPRPHRRARASGHRPRAGGGIRLSAFQPRRREGRRARAAARGAKVAGHLSGPLRLRERGPAVGGARGARRMDRPRGRPAGRRAAHGRHRRAGGLAGRPDRHAFRRQPAEGDPRPLPLRLAVDPPPR